MKESLKSRYIKWGLHCTVACRLSELVTNVVRIFENSDNWIKFLSTKKHYYNVLYYYNTKNQQTCKTGET
jgi:hypothetical protein